MTERPRGEERRRDVQRVPHFPRAIGAMPAVAADDERNARAGQDGDAGIGRRARRGEPLRRDADSPGVSGEKTFAPRRPSWRGATMRSAALSPFAGLFR